MIFNQYMKNHKKWGILPFETIFYLFQYFSKISRIETDNF